MKDVGNRSVTDAEKPGYASLAHRAREDTYLSNVFLTQFRVCVSLAPVGSAVQHAILLVAGSGVPA
jgi:hypothetical protein